MASYVERLRQLAPHYVAIVLLILIALTIVDAALEDPPRGLRIGVALVIAIAYPLILRALGRAPEPWT